MLLYSPSYIVSGEDEIGALNIARSLAEVMNILSASDLFKCPEMYKTPYYGVHRVLNLNKGDTKMCKSAKNKRATIFLDDPEPMIREKVIRAKSDSTKKVPPRAKLYRFATTKRTGRKFLT